MSENPRGTSPIKISELSASGFGDNILIADILNLLLSNLSPDLIVGCDQRLHIGWDGSTVTTWVDATPSSRTAAS